MKEPRKPAALPVQARRKGNKANNLVASVLKFFIAPLAVLFVAGIATSTKVTDSTAHIYFDNYFAKVTQADQRWKLYNEDLTVSYRQYPDHSWKSYVAYWEAQKHVTIDSVYPVSGNPFEFTVGLTLNYSPPEVVINYWLVCNGLIGQLIGRLPQGCPLNDIQIDNGQQVSQSN